MKETSENILYDMANIWRDASKRHRDAQLQVGKLIHIYIQKKLTEGDGLTEDQRWKQGYTREKCLLQICEKLAIDVVYARHMLGTAMVVELLSDRGDVGSLAWSTLKLFQSTVRRVHRKIEGKGAGIDLPSSAIEIWEIAPECREWAIPNFREAVREGWKSKDVERFLRSQKGEKKEVPKKRCRSLEEFMRTIKRTDVKRAAEMILEVISVSKNPRLLKKTIECRLGREQAPAGIRLASADEDMTEEPDDVYDEAEVLS